MKKSLAIAVAMIFIGQSTLASHPANRNADIQALLKKEARLEKELHQMKMRLMALQYKDEAKHRRLTPHERKRKLHRRKPIHKKYNHKVITYIGGTPVVTSPYLGVRSEYDGSELIVNLPSANEDLRLLKQRQRIEQSLLSRGKKMPEHPLVELSGKLEGVYTFSDPYTGSNRSRINLGSAELDTTVHIHRWVTAFFSLTYDGSPPVLGPRSSNSRIFLNKGFVSVGNLNRFPGYFSVGQMFLPFGRYSSAMISSPVTLLLGRTKGRTVVIGFQQHGHNAFFGQAYYYNGDTLVGGRNQAGVNLGYDFENKHAHGNVAVGVISNMADSDRMLTNGLGGAGVFPGFSMIPAPGTNLLTRRVPAVNVHTKISSGNVAVIGEFTSAIRRFSPADLTFNGVGAKPWALHAEAIYQFHVKEHPGSIAFSYGRTSQAFALNLPKDRYMAALNFSFWRDTLQTLEFRHEKNYPFGTTATGRGLGVPGGALGLTNNLLTLQMAIYF